MLFLREFENVCLGLMPLMSLMGVREGGMLFGQLKSQTEGYKLRELGFVQIESIPCKPLSLNPKVGEVLERLTHPGLAIPRRGGSGQRILHQMGPFCAFGTTVPRIPGKSGWVREGFDLGSPPKKPFSAMLGGNWLKLG